MKRFSVLSLSLVAVLAFAGCNDTKKADAGGAATKTASSSASKVAMCVACGKPAGDKPVAVSFKGQSASACCADCAKSFNAMSDKDKDAKMVAAMKH